MRHLLRLLAAAALVLSTAVASADLGDQLFELLPDDGMPSARFGSSVAISGTTAIIGAPKDQVNGIYSGSAYLFDTTTGQQIDKLLPDDYGAHGDRFGCSVAISGTTAIVGACATSDNGTNSGSAYLFDTSTGTQLAKLLPDDGTAWEFFGFAVAISGTTAIIGLAEDDDDNNGTHTNEGSAYLFDTTTGGQLAKLLPDDSAIGDRFGFSVAISGTTAIIGSPMDDEVGPGDQFCNSGSAYLFDTTTGQQIAKLLPSDGAAIDFFGYSVAIRGTTSIVGAWGDDANGAGSGSAYTFDITTGQQLAKLLPDDGSAGDGFGGGGGGGFGGGVRQDGVR